jgi:L-ascorbate metabolism protein UlaG (beta-lactamase superfamily)
MYYLKEQVYFEPLFNHWYAWPYLIPPVQCARHIVNTHQRIMKSFVNNYQLHILACKEPGMEGSEYMACSEEQLDDVRALLGSTEKNCSDMIALCNSINELDELLSRHGNGESIEWLYGHIPELLKGYIELFYDLNHNLSYRLIEALLYKSRFYREDLQTVSFGLVDDHHDRPFVFSTPRLADAHHVHINLHFNSPLLERVLQAREIPLTEQEIADIECQIQCSGGLAFRSLFTTNSPLKSTRPTHHGVRLQYTGHAGFLVESADISILVDPVIASRHEQIAAEVFSFSQLPEKIDFICLTHSHQDHANLETLLQLRYKTEHILVPKNNGGALQDPSLKLLLKQLGFNVTEMEDMEELKFKGGRIVSLPFLGEHGDLNIRSKTAWYLELGGKKIFLGADSSNLDLNMYRHIHNVLGDMDVLAIGMECVGAPYTWLYGALLSKKVSKNIKESRRLNGCDGERGFYLAQLFSPGQVFIYALGMESWFKYFMGLEYDDDSEQMLQSAEMQRRCQAAGIACETLCGKKTLEFS